MLETLSFPIPSQFTECELDKKRAYPCMTDKATGGFHCDMRQRVLFDQIREIYPPALIQAVGFLAQHFTNDIAHSQAGPYEYSDQERDATQAVIRWSDELCARMGIKPEQLGDNSKATFHQADRIAEEYGRPRQQWQDSEANA